MATKLKKLRIAASRQLRVPIVPPRSCSASPRNAADEVEARENPSGLAAKTLLPHQEAGYTSAVVTFDPSQLVAIEQGPNGAFGEY
ncbi:hypothetical protein IE4872_PA00090 (plasmid) [Rhizobium gallicum]|uniref:Uncharacterized protein n=1 Tax=Rhizobium gallicum TaxID=56730 RepID=A0A1L5NPL6_9HYPH|nr:hypothetical protein [Rhizobium gallicum]APO69836.1 hypothetical protein IE4872_PA00090 [Rhizobium gallicum]